MRFLRWAVPGLVAAACLAGPAVAGAVPFVYVTVETTHQVFMFDAAGGRLAALRPAAVGTGRAPKRIAVSPSGEKVYVANALDDTVSQYSGGDGPGTLSPLTPATAFTQAVSVGIAIGSPHIPIPFGCVDVINACNVQISAIKGGGTTSALLIKTTPVQAAQFGILVERLVGGHLVLVGHAPFGLRCPWTPEDPPGPESERVPTAERSVPDRAADVRPPRVPGRAPTPFWSPSNNRRGGLTCST